MIALAYSNYVMSFLAVSPIDLNKNRDSYQIQDKNWANLIKFMQIELNICHIRHTFKNNCFSLAQQKQYNQQLNKFKNKLSSNNFRNRNYGSGSWEQTIYAINRLQSWLMSLNLSIIMSYSSSYYSNSTNNKTPNFSKITKL